jgi:hypothetical protein
MSSPNPLRRRRVRRRYSDVLFWTDTFKAAALRPELSERPLDASALAKFADEALLEFQSRFPEDAEGSDE